MLYSYYYNYMIYDVDDNYLDGSPDGFDRFTRHSNLVSFPRNRGKRRNASFLG